MTAFRLTFDHNGNPLLQQDIGGLHPDDSHVGESGWCRAEDTAEWIELLLAQTPAVERAA